MLVDRKVGHPRPAVPGSFVDDGFANGALIGAGSGVGLVLLDASSRCRPGPDKPPCTREGILLDMLNAVEWLTVVGVVVDAAIPSREPARAGTPQARSRKQVAIRVNLRF